jgi:hypothetical protein
VHRRGHLHGDRTDASHLLTWSLGTMAGGTSRQVTFKVTIDDVPGAAGQTVAVDILNAGAVKSDLVPTTPSNQVVTPVSKVLPAKVGKPPVVVLPHTGVALPVDQAVGGGARPARARCAAGYGRTPAQHLAAAVIATASQPAAPTPDEGHGTAPGALVTPSAGGLTHRHRA